jgi:acetyl esterase
MFFARFTAPLGAALLLGACAGNHDADKSAANTAVDSTTVVADTSTIPAADRMADASMGQGKPTGPKPAWAPTITGPMQAVIEELESFKNPPIPTLTAEQARQLPLADAAVKKLMKDQNIPLPPSKVDTTGKTLPGGLHARIYTPQGTTGPLPIIVYYHGGGWVIATIDTYDASARALAEKVGAVVVAVEYRKGPEHKFPAAHDDAFAAYEWTLKNAASIHGDPARVAVVGESAGGNLACNVSIMARDKKRPMPKAQVLVYPVASVDMTTPSYQKNAQAKPLDKPMMGWFAKNYFRTPADGKDPRISLVNANLKGLPPTTVITAEIDPLMSDGQMLSDKLKAAGVEVTMQNYAGVTHEFFGMDAVLPEAREAQGLAVSHLKAGFGL